MAQDDGEAQGTEGESAVRTCVRACVKVREGE